MSKRLRISSQANAPASAEPKLTSLFESGNDGPGRSRTHIGSALTEAEIRHMLLHPKPPMPSFKGLPKRRLRVLVRFLTLLR